jgi:hypothetical protein
MSSDEDFRVRCVPAGFAVWQRIGSGWERLADVYDTRTDARAAVKRWCGTPTEKS